MRVLQPIDDERLGVVRGGEIAIPPDSDPDMTHNNLSGPSGRMKERIEYRRDQRPRPSGPLGRPETTDV